MKHIKYTIVILLCMVVFSCTTTQTISIKGEPGSEIYSPDMSRLGVINETGSVDITLPSEGYYAYLLSQDKDSKQLIPFALDYKNHIHIGDYIMKNAGISMAVIGTTGIIGSLIAGLVIGEEDTTIAGVMGLCSLAATGIGAGIGVPGEQRTKQTQQLHHFKYKSQHRTNQDIEFVPIKDNGVKKQTTENGITNSAEIDKNVTNTSEKTSISKHKIKKTFSIYGMHKGTGTLYSGNDIIEKYENIVIKIEKISNEKVFVSVFENGEQYFNAESIYTLENNKDTYILNMEDIPSSTITIDKNGNMEYIHPKVNIEDEIYTLKISVNK